MPDARYRLQSRIGYRVSRAAALMQRRFETACAGLGVTRMSWTALASIGLEGVATPSALAQHMGINRPAASRLIAGLERDGLVARTPDAADGRGVRLGLTAEGRLRLEAVFPAADAVNRRFAAMLTETERRELFRLLDKLTADEGEGVSRL